SEWVRTSKHELLRKYALPKSASQILRHQVRRQQENSRPKLKIVAALSSSCLPITIPVRKSKEHQFLTLKADCLHKIYFLPGQPRSGRVSNNPFLGLRKYSAFPIGLNTGRAVPASLLLLYLPLSKT